MPWHLILSSTSESEHVHSLRTTQNFISFLKLSSSVWIGCPVS